MRAMLIGLIALMLATAGAALPTRAADKIDSGDRDQEKIMNEMMRAAQVGLLRDFKSLFSLEERVNLVKAATLPPESRSLPKGQYRPEFLNGGAVRPNSFIDVVKITFRQDDRSPEETCSGIVLSDFNFVILTAAHCSCGKLDTYKIFRGDIAANHGNNRFVLGAPPERYAEYSCQQPPERQIGRDLAVLRFVEIEKENEPPKPPFDQWFIRRNISIALVATMHEVYLDSKTKWLTGVGFGITETGAVSKNAMAGIIPIASFFCAGGRFANSACAGFREFVLADPAGATKPVDSCGGDSGAPIFWVAPGIDSKGEMTLERFLVGITSRALAGVRHYPGTNCGGGGIYTMVGHPDVIQWLRTFDVRTRSKLSVEQTAKRNQ